MLYSADFLDIYNMLMTDYFHDIIKTSGENNGYGRNVNIFKLASDFRDLSNLTNLLRTRIASSRTPKF